MTLRAGVVRIAASCYRVGDAYADDRYCLLAATIVRAALTRSLATPRQIPENLTPPDHRPPIRRVRTSRHFFGVSTFEVTRIRWTWW